jgi:hypothetical protein
LWKGFHEQHIDENFSSLVSLLFLHGRPLVLTRAVIFKGN